MNTIITLLSIVLSLGCMAGMFWLGYRVGKDYSDEERNKENN